MRYRTTSLSEAKLGTSTEALKIKLLAVMGMDTA